MRILSLVFALLILFPLLSGTTSWRDIHDSVSSSCHHEGGETSLLQEMPSQGEHSDFDDCQAHCLQHSLYFFVFHNFASKEIQTLNFPAYRFLYLSNQTKKLYRPPIS